MKTKEDINIKKPNVVILDHSNNPVNTIYTAIRTCQSYLTPSELSKTKKSRKHKLNMISNTTKSGHTSVLGHAFVCFGIEFVSRIPVSQQMVRYQTASGISQQSQRTIDTSKSCNFNLPEKLIKKHPELKDAFIENYLRAVEFIEKLKEDLDPEYLDELRYSLPNGASTNLVLSMNTRTLSNYFNQRRCTRATYEHKQIAELMFKAVKNIDNDWKELMKLSIFGPACLKHGICPEGKFSCGKYPTYEEVMEVYNKHKIKS
jgi:thymidylate synthase (FAD)